MIDRLMNKARAHGASDLHLADACRPMQRVDGNLIPLADEIITWQMTEAYVRRILTSSQMDALRKNRDLDIAFEDEEGWRSRVNIFFAEGKLALAIRLLKKGIPTCEELQLPQAVRSFAELRRGLVLITGATGSGKSSTIAALLNKINHDFGARIITLEDPVEYIYNSDKSMISQREIGRDANSFADGLRSALREDPDVIMIGEMRDCETAATALTAAETGHLVFTTMHTGDVAGTVSRIMGLQQDHQQQTRIQLAEILQGIACQQLLPRKGGGRVAAFEVLAATEAMRNIIRDGRIHMLASYVQTGGKYGMTTMEQYVEKLRGKGIIN